MVFLIFKIKSIQNNFENILLKINQKDQNIFAQSVTSNKIFILSLKNNIKDTITIILEKFNLTFDIEEKENYFDFKNDLLSIKIMKANEDENLNEKIQKKIEKHFNNSNISKFENSLNNIYIEHLKEKYNSNHIIKEIFEEYSKLKNKYDDLILSKKKFKKLDSNKENFFNNEENIIDKIIEKFKQEKEIKNNFEKINPGIYKYFNKVLHIFYLKNSIKIRIGGGYISLEDFYNIYIKNDKILKRNSFKSKNNFKNIKNLSPVIVNKKSKETMNKSIF